ncbi:MAG: RNA 2',3'-cyclic phosphodiesterase [Chitinispirillaceae bacterium]|nr:RNA 2',3'-cyclic phosphodiesterase [Chitinispirillaceae bacterium]
MIRLFIAIDIPERIKDEITDTYRAIPGARWIDETNLHCTLRFIGEVPETATNTIISSLCHVSSSPLILKIRNSGFFPPRKEPRILWFGFEHPPEFLTLQSKIERACTNSGLEPELRKFHPHITVARLNNPHKEKVAEFIISNALFMTEQFEVSEFHLYRSHTGKYTSHYEKLVSFPLYQMKVL